MKGERSGVVGPVFAGVADPIGSASSHAGRRSPVLAKELVRLQRGCARRRRNGGKPLHFL
jgi:hypothetical protein